MSNLKSKEANRKTLLAKARELQNGQYFTAEIPGNDLEYSELQLLIAEISLAGVVVVSMAGCGECEAHKEFPVPQKLPLLEPKIL